MTIQAAGSGHVFEEKVPCDLLKIKLEVNMGPIFRPEFLKDGALVKPTEQRTAEPLKFDNSRAFADYPLCFTPEVAQWTRDHAIVVMLVLPAVAGKPLSSTRAITPANKRKIRGSAKLTAEMGPHCAKHLKGAPTHSEMKPDRSDAAGPAWFELETKEWSFKELLDCLWGEGHFHELLFGAQRKVITFEAASCALPVSGDGTSRLSALLCVASADEWVFDFKVPAGFVFQYERSRTETYRTKESRVETTRSSQTSVLGEVIDEEPEKETVEIKRGSSVQYRDTGEGEPYSPGRDSKSIEARVARDKHALKEKEAADLKYHEETNQLTFADKIKAAAQYCIDDAARTGMALSIKRNGTELIAGEAWEGWEETYESFTEIGESLFEIISRLAWMVEHGLSFGAPFSGKFEISINVRLLQFSLWARAWPEQTAVQHTSSLYVTEYQKRWQAGLGLTPFDGELTLKAKGMAKLFHEHVASVAISAEFKGVGSSRVDWSGDWTQAERVSRETASLRLSVKAAAEASAASFYIKAEGELTGAMTYTAIVPSDPEGIGKIAHEIDNSGVEFQLTARSGNKILDFFSMRKSGAEARWWEKDWKWPEHGPLVLVEQGALKREW